MQKNFTYIDIIVILNFKANKRTHYFSKIYIFPDDMYSIYFCCWLF